MRLGLPPLPPDMCTHFADHRPLEVNISQNWNQIQVLNFTWLYSGVSPRNTFEYRIVQNIIKVLSTYPCLEIHPSRSHTLQPHGATSISRWWTILNVSQFHIPNALTAHSHSMLDQGSSFIHWHYCDKTSQFFTGCYILGYDVWAMSQHFFSLS